MPKIHSRPSKSEIDFAATQDKISKLLPAPANPACDAQQTAITGPKQSGEILSQIHAIKFVAIYCDVYLRDDRQISLNAA